MSRVAVIMRSKNERPHLPAALARLFSQTLELLKEWARDFLYAIRKGRLDTIPYNIAYRAVIHTGLYRGLKAGTHG